MSITQLYKEFDEWSNDDIENNKWPPGLVQSGVSLKIPDRNDTTSKCKPDDQTGRYKDIVYFDWHENWDKVKKCLLDNRVRESLKYGFHDAKKMDPHDYYFIPEFDDNVLGPFYLLGFPGRTGNGQEASIIADILPRKDVKGGRQEQAELFKEYIEQNFEEANMDYKFTLDYWFDEWFSSDQYSTFHNICNDYYIEYLKKFHDDCRIISHAKCPWPWIPFTFRLAFLINLPRIPKLKIVSSDNHAGVLDVDLNVWYDASYYFMTKISASEAFSIASEGEVTIDPYHPYARWNSMVEFRMYLQFRKHIPAEIVNVIIRTYVILSTHVNT